MMLTMLRASTLKTEIIVMLTATAIHIVVLLCLLLPQRMILILMHSNVNSNSYTHSGIIMSPIATTNDTDTDA